MATRVITPLIGVDVTKNVGPLVDPPTNGHTLGTTVFGSDGHEYVLAKSGGTIAATTVVVLTEPAMTFAAGAGSWTAPVASVSGDYVWLQKTAI